MASWILGHVLGNMTENLCITDKFSGPSVTF